MSAAPLVSVLLTAYNREKYIPAAIESVLAQTFSDFELLIVDDCSTDRTFEIAAEYAVEDRRIRVVRNEANLGDYPNRNHAATMARGSYLKYHDSDDVMYPHCLATMVAPLAAYPSAGFALSTGRHWPGGPCPMLLSPRMCYQREFLGYGMFMCGPSGALFRAPAFRELGGFPERGVGSDNLFWLYACARVSVLLLPGDLFWYRVHSAQELLSERAERDYAIVPGEAWRALSADACPLTSEERELARRNLVYGLWKYTYRDLRRGRFRSAAHRIRASKLSVRDWLTYTRRPRRHQFAGTPLDANADFVIPDWPTALRQEATVGEGSKVSP
jgi:glycosyltransferase involved in cell wall biosynthesis